MEDPYLKAVAVTPHDSNLIETCDALMIGVTGTLKVGMGNGTVAFGTVPAGLLRIRVNKVFTTDTTATSITALYYKP